MIWVTGCAGFIGSNFVHTWLERHDEPIIKLDKLTYAGNLNNLLALAEDVRHTFVQCDIGDRATVDALLAKHKPRVVLNLQPNRMSIARSMGRATLSRPMWSGCLIYSSRYVPIVHCSL